jgi:transposase
VRHDGSLHHLLTRLGLTWQRARAYVRSPDPADLAKLAAIATAVAATRHDPTVVTLYLDEVTIYRQPTLAAAWAACRDQPRASRSHASDTATRVVATLDAHTGRVLYQRRGRLTVPALVDFYQHLCRAYPWATRLNVVVDNWPVHWHPDVLVALQPQVTPWRGRLPRTWASTPAPAAHRRWGALALPIQLLPLPTYASWANPIEKLWRWLRQDLTHLHPFANDLASLRTAIDHFLDRFAAGSPALLRYVGLLVPE